MYCSEDIANEMQFIQCADNAKGAVTHTNANGYQFPASTKLTWLAPSKTAGKLKF